MPVVSPPSTPRSKSKRRRTAEPKVPRTHRPADLTTEEWQAALRRQDGREKPFKLAPADDGPRSGDGFFGDHIVTDSDAGRAERVTIRGAAAGLNDCTCGDFATNALGTCEHVEFVLFKLERRPGGRRRLAEGCQPPYTEVVVRLGADGRRLWVRPGTAVDPAGWRKAARLLDPSGSLRPDDFGRFDALLRVLRTGGHDVRPNPAALAWVADHRDRRASAERIDASFPHGASDPAWDADGNDRLTRVPLYPYQRAGALFLARGGRAVLADDMGLGKTIQSIAAAEILARGGDVKRVLVVAPTSLKHQWRREIAAVTGRPTLVVEGPPARRHRQLADPAPDFKIVNYETLHLDADPIAAWAPELVILDEAQRVKNWATRTARVVRALHSRFLFVLTGTPLENRLEELHTIVGLVDPYRLGPMFRFLADHQQLNADGRVVGYNHLADVTRTLAPVLLRRTKGQVLNQLPRRTDEQVLVPMTPEQAALHEDNRQTVARLVFRWRRMRFLTEADQRRLTCALQNMRMSCNSTYLLDHETDFGHKADAILEHVDGLLDEPGAKVVIFSQWVRSHELLMRRLRRRKHKFVFLHGGVPGPQRQPLIDRFREDDRCRVFLSTDAGGVGLNLQAASAVLNMDQPWNPAILEQRVGRVHRLGQTRPVTVVHFIAKDTIEHGMLDLIKFKRSLFNGVLDGEQDAVYLGGTRLQVFMDGVEAATTALPGPAPEPEEDQTPPPADEPAVTTPVEEATTVVPSAEVSQPSEPEPPPAPPPAPAAPDGFGPLLDVLADAGRTLLRAWSQPPRPAAGDAPLPSPIATFVTAARSAVRVESDPGTGQPYLRLSAPSADLVAGVGRLLAALTARLTGEPPAAAKPTNDPTP